MQKVPLRPCRHRNKKICKTNFGGRKMGQKCPLFSSTSLSDPPNMPKWCKNYQNMHKSAKLCIQMQKYAHKCKNGGRR